MTVYRNMEEAIPAELQKLVDASVAVVSRNGMTGEILGEVITLQNPYERFHTLKHRNANPFAQIAETLWVLSGHNDIEWLSWYLPRAKDFSDDGMTWRAGYGVRLRKWIGVAPAATPGKPYGGFYKSYDQLSDAYQELKAHPESRRAVISLWDPARDYVDSKDIPCNDWIQFLVRHNKLHMFVTARSNDAMWGWSGINAFEWSVLQEVMARSLGVAIGTMTTFVGSFHLYQRHWERAIQIASAYKREASPKLYVGSSTPAPYWNWHMEVLDERIAGIVKHEQGIRNNPLYLSSVGMPNVLDQDILRMFDIYARLQNNDDSPEGIRVRISSIHAPDMRAAALEYVSRTAPEVATSITGNERYPVVTNLLTQLQAAKGRMYGDSWKKHGELVSIMANISRKYDRIENLRARPDSDPGDETMVDTIADLTVYATLYHSWLTSLPFVESLGLITKYISTTRRDSQAYLDTITAAYHQLEAVLGLADRKYGSKSKGELALDLAQGGIRWLEAQRASHTGSWKKFVDYVTQLNGENTDGDQ